MVHQIDIKVSGRVQGVFFRACAQEEARRLGLAGFVKNTDDGGVGITAQGEEKALNEFLEWCKKGPDGAMVESVQFKKTPVLEKFVNFAIQ